ncbi:phage tail tube protein [Acetobacter persici]|uniref:phage tail tube protein n=1 Tax=Acetobacter persici TaxID=1076596 RepID=UPI001BAC4541|nr:phage tail tube protein [Acetobacter persici]MBS1015401.1 phage tail tube protein [Acetobacter persici]MCP9318765.1 phage tail tube protein [Acetobacter persici]
MASQFLQGVESAYINGIAVPTTEEVTYTVPQTLYDYAESNQGPLEDVLKWNKEAGTINMTIVHTKGMSYVDMFKDNNFFEVVVNSRSGDTLIGHNCILTENPNHSSVAATTEVRFKSMNVELDLASN